MSNLSLDDIEVDESRTEQAAAGDFASAPAATRSVEFVRTPMGLGLTVDSQNKVLAIAKDGQANRSGRIAVGSQLVSINDVPLSGGGSFEEQLDAIAVGTKVRLVIMDEADPASDPAIEAAATAAAALAAAELAGGAPTGGAAVKSDTDPYDPYESEVVAAKSEDPYETENEELSGPTSKSASQDVTPGGETDDDEEALVRRSAWITLARTLTRTPTLTLTLTLTPTLTLSPAPTLALALALALTLTLTRCGALHGSSTTSPRAT